MKELSIEEKARRYDEVIERAKKLYEQGTITESLSYVFPELAEPDDEKIKKWLIGYFKQYRIDGMETVYASSLNVDDIIAWLEKQDEHEPIWSEEDYKMFDKVIEDIEKLAGPYVCYHKDVEFIKSLKDRVQLKQEWSAGDEAMHCSIIDTEQQMIRVIDEIQKINEMQKIFTNIESFKERYYKEIRWIESIKNRLQSKSLWKPTDEQIGALEEAIGDGDSEILISLYNDLKKLC